MSEDNLGATSSSSSSSSIEEENGFQSIIPLLARDVDDMGEKKNRFNVRVLDCYSDQKDACPELETRLLLAPSLD
jgi:hypothetical protein